IACRRPHGPTRIGPNLACMKARIFRSRYTRNMITTESARKTISTLIAPSITGCAFRIWRTSTMISDSMRLPIHFTEHNVDGADDRHHVSHQVPLDHGVEGL